MRGQSVYQMPMGVMQQDQEPLHSHDHLLPQLGRDSSAAEVQFRRLLYSTESQLAAALDEVASTEMKREQLKAQDGPLPPLPFFPLVAKLQHVCPGSCSTAARQAHTPCAALLLAAVLSHPGRPTGGP
jgi:hypothetical protein